MLYSYVGRLRFTYEISSIEITRKFAENSLQDWNLDNITERDLKLSDEIISKLDSWRKIYEEQSESTVKKVPTPEELAIIEDFKKRGLI